MSPQWGDRFRLCALCSVGLSPPSSLVRQYVAGLPISDALERPILGESA